MTETAKLGGRKPVTFGRTVEIPLKEAFHYMHFYPSLYGQEKYPTEFQMPVGELTDNGGKITPITGVRKGMLKWISVISMRQLRYFLTQN